jgi:hypothetical protein
MNNEFNLERAIAGDTFNEEVNSRPEPFCAVVYESGLVKDPSPAEMDGAEDYVCLVPELKRLCSRPTSVDYNKSLSLKFNYQYLQLVERVRIINRDAANYLTSLEVQAIPSFDPNAWRLDQAFIWLQSPQGEDY